MAKHVLIVGDNRLYREGLARVLNENPRTHVVGMAQSRSEALAAAAAMRPEVVLLDMVMADALATARHLIEAAPGLKVVALGVAEIESEVVACAEAGIASYVTRDGTLDDLMQAMDSAVRGELRCSPQVAGSLLRRVSSLASERPEQPDLCALTNREIRILGIIEQGLSNKEIARALAIEVATVKNHVHHILEKLHVSRRGEAAALFRRYRANLDPPRGSI